MTEIKPRLVEGEPVCDRECRFFDDDSAVDHWCEIGEYLTCDGADCIPGLRQQRDEARARPAPALDWKTGEPPEGVEVLFERSILGWDGERVMLRLVGHRGRVATESAPMMSSTVGVPLCESANVTRWVKLTDLLKMIGEPE